MAVATRFSNRMAVYAPQKTTANDVEVPCGSSASIARKGTTIAPDASFAGRAVVAANGTGRYPKTR